MKQQKTMDRVQFLPPKIPFSKVSFYQKIDGLLIKAFSVEVRKMSLKEQTETETSEPSNCLFSTITVLQLHHC